MTLNCNLRFKSANQQLPTKAGEYICITHHGRAWQKLDWSPKQGRFNASDWQETPKHAIKVDWWAPLPRWSIT